MPLDPAKLLWPSSSVQCNERDRFARHHVTSSLLRDGMNMKIIAKIMHVEIHWS